jgi:NAD+ kinase
MAKVNRRSTKPAAQSKSTAPSGDRVIVVAKRTAYTKFVTEDSDPRARDLLRRSDPSVRRWKKAHEDHLRTLERVERALQAEGARVWMVHGPHKAFDSNNATLVITVGGDGTLLAASHHVRDAPVLGVNSSPNHSIGFFCAAHAGNVREVIAKALHGVPNTVPLARMGVDLDGRKVSRRVLNEALFCHAIPAATSRYILRFQRRGEEQRSSGVWVGTAAGSTGALRSAGGRILPLTSRQLQLVVREPYQGEARPYTMERLVIEENRSVTLQNKMHDAWLFLDGPFKKERVALGQTIRFKISDQSLNVVGISRRRFTRKT